MVSFAGRRPAGSALMTSAMPPDPKNHATTGDRDVFDVENHVSRPNRDASDLDFYVILRIWDAKNAIFDGRITAIYAGNALIQGT